VDRLSDGTLEGATLSVEDGTEEVVSDGTLEGVTLSVEDGTEEVVSDGTLDGATLSVEDGTVVELSDGKLEGATLSVEDGTEEADGGAEGMTDGLVVEEPSDGGSVVSPSDGGSGVSSSGSSSSVIPVEGLKVPKLMPGDGLGVSALQSSKKNKLLLPNATNGDVSGMSASQKFHSSPLKRTALVQSTR